MPISTPPSLKSSYLLYLQDQLDKSRDYLTVVLDYHLELLDNATLRERISVFLRDFQGDLAADGKLTKLASNELLVDKLDKAIYTFIEKDLENLMTTIEDETAYTTEDKEQVNDIFTPLIHHLNACQRKAFAKQKHDIDESLALKSHIEQRLCHESQTLKPAFNELLIQLNKAFAVRYKAKNRWAKENLYPSCFISYAWPLIPDDKQNETWTQPFIYQLALDLRQAGVNVHMDKLDSYAGMNVVSYMKEQVNDNDFIFVMGTQSLYAKHYQAERYKSRVREELAHIRNRIEQDNRQQAEKFVAGVLVSGSEESSFPQELAAYKITRSFQGAQTSYLKVLEQLLRQLYDAKTQEQTQQFDTYWAAWQTQASTLQATVYQGIQPQLLQGYYEDFLKNKLEQQQRHLLNSKQLLQELKNESFSMATSASFNIQHNLPYAQNPQFIGRQTALTHINQVFKQEKVSAIIQTAQGLGGIGKTQLALEYAWRGLESKQYQLVWWLMGTDEATLQTSYLSLSDALDIPADNDTSKRIQATTKQLATLSNWLLIIDDAKDYQTVQPFIPTGPGHVLITTRSIKHWKQSLKLDVFEREESIAFLAKTLERDEKDSQFNQDADKLAKLLGDLPLALAQAAAYMKTVSLSMTDYIVLFKQERLELWESEEAPTDYQSTVKTTWSINKDKLSENAKQLLNYCSYLDTVPIPKVWLAGLFTTQLIYLNALSELTQFSLLTATETTLIVHQLVQNVVRDCIPEQQQLQDGQTFKQLFNDYYTQLSGLDAIAQQRLLLPHIVKLLNEKKLEDNLENHIILNACNNLISMCCKLGQAKQSLPYCERVLAITEKVLGGDPLTTATSYSNVGMVYQALGKPKEALDYEDSALVIRQQKLGENHWDTAASYNNIGMFYQYLGKPKKALDYVKKALAIQQKIFGENHLATATSYNNIGMCYQYLGKPKKALDYVKKALAIKEKEQELGKKHSATAISYNSVSYIYQYSGKFEKALGYAKKALAIQEQVFGENHSDTTTSYNNIGMIYRDLGEYQQALVYLKKALSIRQHILEENHPNIATSYNNIGIVYRDLDEHREALAYLEKALDIQQQILGENHPNTAMFYNNVGHIYQDLGEHQKALTYVEKALAIYKEVLGAMHDETINAKDNLQSIQEDLLIEYVNNALGNQFTQRYTNTNNAKWVIDTSKDRGLTLKLKGIAITKLPDCQWYEAKLLKAGVPKNDIHFDVIKVQQDNMSHDRYQIRITNTEALIKQITAPVITEQQHSLSA